MGFQAQRIKITLNSEISQPIFWGLMLPLQFLLFLFGAGSSLLFSGCATTEKVSECKTVDWYELGRRDGSLGRTLEDFDPQRMQCEGRAIPSFEAMYRNGRERGLIEFCAPENGYSVGKSGELYYYVCPFHLEAEFLREYKRGQKVLALQRENLKLDQRMSSVFSALRNPASTEGREQLESELSTLRQTRAKNEQELNRLQ